jgi:hypothetical protein
MLPLKSNIFKVAFFAACRVIAFCIAIKALLLTNCRKIMGVLPELELAPPVPPELELPPLAPELLPPVAPELELAPIAPELLLSPLPPELDAPSPELLLSPLAPELELAPLPPELLLAPPPHFEAGFSVGKVTLPTHLKFFIAKEPVIADSPGVVPTSPTSSQANA